MRRFTWIPAALLALTAQGAEHPSAHPVDLAESFVAALARSETVASQNEAIIQQEELYAQAKGGLLPSISAVASYLVQEKPANSVGSTISPSTHPLARLTATQPLFRGFREFAGLRQA